MKSKGMLPTCRKGTKVMNLMEIPTTYKSRPVLPLAGWWLVAGWLVVGCSMTHSNIIQTYNFNA